MADEVVVLEEPSLRFRYEQEAIEPHDGLGLFGAYDADQPSAPRSPAYIAIGTADGLELLDSWSRAMNQPAMHERAEKHQLWPPFPGFHAAFGTAWPEQAVWTHAVDSDELLRASRLKDGHERCYAVTELFLRGFQQAKKLDANVAVAICVVPDEVWLNCRPKSRVLSPIDDDVPAGRREARRRGQTELFEDVNVEQYRFAPDFRRQLKARTMRFDIPFQIIRASTMQLDAARRWGGRQLTPLSDRLWNLSTGLYYKCGGKPWKLSTTREGVCYVGLAFRRAPDGHGASACCAAQMFLDSGDGIVFLGEYGPWYSERTHQFHLTRKAAGELLRGVLKTSDTEADGYREACPDGVRLVGIRVRSDRFGPRLFRNGQMPVLRGTLWTLSDRSAYLLGSGFKPRLGTYDGAETPVPLRIDIQHGDADVRQVAADIFGLTKLNYNACRLGDREPVTIGFSDDVGEILISNPTVAERRPNFKFYI